MNSTGAVFTRRAASPTHSAGYAITALISSSAMRCARALGRIAISTPQSVLPLFEKVQYTFHGGRTPYRYAGHRHDSLGPVPGSLIDRLLR